MNIIKSKLTKINSNWNEYYFIKEFFQKRINFTDEVKTNYYGDLNNYLHDTLDLVKPFKKIKSDANYISQIIVLLQVIYTQQDLIVVFPKSNKQNLYIIYTGEKKVI
ncbi:hypothetical protein L5F37_10410 [Aliarcobacter butzleri]|uniref:hypothetical protein n=1 Tax=Aliarcobacter butzleri TaxID=28197 RepID=UPI001EDADA48|nr:hypothetical protein [Aliarcobacter butzleri]MCG3663819.1 hypothetical protein [Aliarcobacter butzleri]